MLLLIIKKESRFPDTSWKSLQQGSHSLCPRPSDHTGEPKQSEESKDGSEVGGSLSKRPDFPIL